MDYLPRLVDAQIPDLLPTYCLAQIADFNTLIAKSQEHRTPVFALTDEQLGHVGTVLAGDKAKMREFNDVFSNLADKVEKLTNNESRTRSYKHQALILFSNSILK